MNRLISLSTSRPVRSSLAVLIALAGVLGPAAVGRPDVARAAEASGLPANPASMAVETTYLLKSSLRFAAGTVSTAETITIRNRAKVAISSINLSVMPRAFGELVSLSDVRVAGKPVSSRWTNNANLLVELGQSVAPGSSTVITLTFVVRASGAISTSLEGRLSKASNIMQVSHWFPIVSNGHEVRYPGDSQFTRTARKIRLELTTDSAAVKIAAPGRRISLNGRTHVYEIDNARDFAFGASPAYRLLSGTVAGVAVHVYSTTGNASAALRHAKAAIAKFEQVFGQYQWSRYVIAQTGRASSGNEYPGIVFLGNSLFSDRETVAHETAHQWWYAMAGNDQMREPWLDEGISEFAAAYFFGELHPYKSSRPINSTVYDFPAVPAPQTSGQPESYDQTVYNKAAGFLEGLRVRMGSTKFFAGLRDFFAANRNGLMTTPEFYDTMARHGASTAYMRQFIRI